MSKSTETTSSTAVRQIRPPPLSQHLREFASRPHAWGVLARNLIPVVGIYGFGWSAALAVFNYWFDGLTALAAIVAAVISRLLRETQPKSVGAMSWVMNLVRGVVTWIFLVGIIALPYWIVLIPLHNLLLGNELRRENELKQRVRWDVYLLVLRAGAMFFMAAHGLYFILVPLMALLLSYFEIWPERALGAVFGDPSRLWEYDPGNPTSQRRLP